MSGYGRSRWYCTMHVRFWRCWFITMHVGLVCGVRSHIPGCCLSFSSVYVRIVAFGEFSAEVPGWGLSGSYSTEVLVTHQPQTAADQQTHLYTAKSLYANTNHHTCRMYSVSQKTVHTYFLSELCQISTDCKNFWQKDSRENRLFW